MGYSYSGAKSTMMCFNTAKLCQFGWYIDLSVPVDKGTNPVYQCALTLVTYAGAKHPIIIKIDSLGSSTDFYMTFNSNTGINSVTQEGANNVTSFQQGGKEKNILVYTFVQAGCQWKLQRGLI